MRGTTSRARATLHRRALRFALAAAILSPAPARAQPAGDQGTPDAPPATDGQPEQPAAEGSVHRSGFAFGADLLVAYTSNVFHEQARRLDNFDSDGGRGERFEGMEGPADIYARPALGVDWSRRLGHGRRLKLSAGVELTAYARNSVANYVELDAAASDDLTRHDRLSLELELIPHRFKENYFNDVGGNKVFDQAIYSQVTPSIGYRREWTGRWSTELEYELALRRFQDPFPHRDTTTHTVSLLLVRELTGHVTAKAGPEIAFAQVDEHMEFGAQVDRSHRDLGVLGELDLDLRHGWAAELDLEYKHKSYPSDDPADDTHYQRRDDAFEAAAEVEKRLTSTWYLDGLLGFTAVRSNRNDPDIDADEVGYTELLIGAGGAAKF